MSSRKKWLFGVLGAFALLIAVAAGYETYQYRSAAGAGPNQDALLLDPTVNILSPATGATFEAGQAVTVEVNSLGSPFEIAAVELHVDQTLAEVQAAPQGGSSPFSAAFTLALADPGIHLLLARAVDINGHQGVSTPVKIEIVENTSGDTAPFFSEAAGPIVLGSGTPVASLPADGQAPPADTPAIGPWNLPPSRWLFNTSNRQDVEAADLESNYQDCAVHLSIWDRTDHETGYAVFRSQIGSPGWQHLADLASVPDGVWTFDDESLPTGPADVSYYVEAFNDVSSAVSNVESLHLVMDPDCPDTFDGPPGFSLEMNRLSIDEPADNAYCYRSFDGVSWHRWPASGFFTPNAEGEIDTGEGPLVFLAEGLDGSKLNTDVTLSLDCWGWRGGELIALGDFMGSKIDPTKAGFVDFRAKGIKARLGTDPALSHLRPDFSLASLPYHTVRITYDPNECKNYLAAGQDPALYCRPLDGYNKGPEGLAPQPYLVWDFQDDKCPAGSGPFHCIPWDVWLQQYQAYHSSGGANFTWDVFDSDMPNGGYGTESPYQRVVKIRPLTGDCLITRSFTVRLTVELLGNLFVGPNASTSVPCENFDTLKDTVDLEIEYGLLSLRDARDGGTSHLEVYGNLEVYSDQAPYNGGVLLAYPDGDFQTIKVLSIDWDPRAGQGDAWDYTPNHTVSLWNGDYFFADIPFYELTPSYGGVVRNFGQGHNKVVVTAHEGESFRMHVGLLDDDGQWLNPDPVCIVDIKFGPLSLAELASEDIYYRQAHMSRGQDGNASCDVQIFLRPVDN